MEQRSRQGQLLLHAARQAICKPGSEAIETHPLEKLLGAFGRAVGGAGPRDGERSGVGPGLGGVGPMNTYAQLPDMAKWILSLCMIAGRLEFYTLLVILTKPFWQR